MKKLLLVCLCGTLLGCDYTVPLVTAPSQPVEARLVGVWQQTRSDGKPARLLVLPLGRTEYFVSYPAGEPEAMFARASLARVGERTLLQLEWFGTAKGATPENNRVYQYAAYDIAGDTLTARLINADHVNRDAKSAEDLFRAIATTTDEADLFREPMVFQEILPDAQTRPEGDAAAAAAALDQKSRDYLKDLGRDVEP